MQNNPNPSRQTIYRVTNEMDSREFGDESLTDLNGNYFERVEAIWRDHCEEQERTIARLHDELAKKHDCPDCSNMAAANRKLHEQHAKAIKSNARLLATVVVLMVTLGAVAVAWWRA